MRESGFHKFDVELRARRILLDIRSETIVHGKTAVARIVGRYGACVCGWLSCAVSDREKCWHNLSLARIRKLRLDPIVTCLDFWQEPRKAVGYTSAERISGGWIERWKRRAMSSWFASKKRGRGSVWHPGHSSQQLRRTAVCYWPNKLLKPINVPCWLRTGTCRNILVCVWFLRGTSTTLKEEAINANDRKVNLQYWTPQHLMRKAEILSANLLTYWKQNCREVNYAGIDKQI